MKATAIIALGLTLTGSLGVRAAEPGLAVTPQAAEFFETRVRPVLAENCFSCHGPMRQKAGLRLDSAASLRKGSDTGPVVIGGQPEQSPLIQAIHYDGNVRMPPKGKLPAQAIEALTTWVKMGTPWPEVISTHAGSTDAKASAAGREHWAFQPVRQLALPAVQDPTWPLTPIDFFILAKLDANGLTPAAPADRRTLLRRVTFDLIGLPPTAEEVDAFVADPSPDAFAKVVDRLLASPHYGERWGRHWLDVARYADTKGYVFTQERRFPYSYTYRDYVIRAFNEDLPYDQFVVHQLAADRLPLGDDKRPLAAMGFLTIGRRFLNNMHDIIDDRIDVVTRGLLGLTVTCARCHDHKFDPIPTRDYYSLHGVFASSVEPNDLPLLSKPERTEAYLAFEKELQAREQEVRKFLDDKYNEMRSRFRAQIGDYLLAVRNTQRLPGEGHYEALSPGDLHAQMIRRWQAFLNQTAKGYHPIFGPWQAFAALPQQEFLAKAPALAADIAAQADPSRPVNRLVAQAFAGPPPASLREVAQRYGEIFAKVDKLWQETQAKAGAPPALPEADQEALRQVLYGAGHPPVVAREDQRQFLDRAGRDRLTALQRRVDQWKVSSPAAPPRAMILQDAPTPQTPHVFLRGNPNNPGPEVPRQFLEVLAGANRRPFQDGSGRLELARAITSKDNGLTARVLVNRIWLHHFGAGLVRTPSDFGLRSEPPTHPELLDYLAGRFMEEGWSIKKLHRLILLSRVYQQRSEDRPEYSRLDPDNRWLWRMNRQRLDFEGLRDALLMVSGKLDLKRGGVAVDLTTMPFTGRRTVYGFIDRQNLPGLFRTFDFASPDTSTPQRYTTTVPQQALFLMNSPFVLEQARNLVSWPELAALDDEQRIQHLYRLAYGRAADPEEVALGLRFVAAPAIAEQEPPEPSAWEEYAQVLLLANEFVFVD